MPPDMTRSSFKRWNPFLGEWVIFAPTTSVRPWSGTVVSPATSAIPGHDPGCYLCPGVARAGGAENPHYTGVYVFDNDFPSLSMGSSADDYSPSLAPSEPAKGICRVVCFSPKHNTTLAEMEPNEINEVIHSFRDQFVELSHIPLVKYVLPFENKGAIIGVSNPHPHGQIYAIDFVPRIPLTQYGNAERYMRDKGSCLFCKVLDNEIADNRRIVTRNNSFVAFIPAFARHTYEMLIMPHRHVPSVDSLTENELADLAAIYHEVLIRYDNLFGMSFPNITLFRNAPCDEKLSTEPYHFHIEFCPPLRSRDKLKYMAGFETGSGNIINPSLPEESAAALRSVPVVHFSRSGNR